MGFGIMASVLTNNVSALAALANGLLPLRKVARGRAEPAVSLRLTPAEAADRDQLPLRPALTARPGEPENDAPHASAASA
ncbi:MAG TPA: hypothetical protein VJY33_13485, partial [Isosphaeraceae bacterium]|nr:hypothetical protein [Isosphaeraceae bacterium]